MYSLGFNSKVQKLSSVSSITIMGNKIVLIIALVKYLSILPRKPYMTNEI